MIDKLISAKAISMSVLLTLTAAQVEQRVTVSWLGSAQKQVVQELDEHKDEERLDKILERMATYRNRFGERLERAGKTAKEEYEFWKIKKLKLMKKLYPEVEEDSQ